jgi:hypothetical protein
MEKDLLCQQGNNLPEKIERCGNTLLDGVCPVIAII